MFRDFVLNPFKGDTLLVDSFEENLVSALHLEVKLDAVASNLVLESLLRGFARRVGEA